MTFLEKADQAKIEFVQGKAFFVAAYLIAPHLETVQALVRRPLKERRVMVGEIPTQAYLLPKRTLNGRCMTDVLFEHISLFGAKASANIFQATYRGTSFPILCGIEERATVIDENKNNTVLLTALAITSLHRQLQYFSYITGVRIYFHNVSKYTYSPIPAEPGVLHIFVDMAPPGECGPLEYSSHLFDRQLHKEMLFVPMHGCVKGRGMVLKTHDGNKDVAYAQILGNNVYILAPLLEYYWDLNTPDLFRKILGNVYTAILDGVSDLEEEARHATPCTEADFIAAISDTDVFRPEYWEKFAEAQRQKIEKHQRELRLAYLILQECVSRKKACTEQAYYRTAVTRMAEDKTSIQLMPEVEQLVVVDGGVHVYTKPIIVDWQGQQYVLGSYAIRATGTGSVCVWAVETTHPHGVPHPHIAKDGLACFGQATDAIMKASADFRMADVMRYVIAWLVHGYTPDLAEHKIEEWISVPQGGGS